MSEGLRFTLKTGVTYGHLRKFTTSDNESRLASLIEFFDLVIEGGADVVPFGREEEVFAAIKAAVTAAGNRGNSTAGSGTTSGPGPATPLPSS